MLKWIFAAIRNYDMEANLPSCGIKASPHIESRVKWLKQTYCALKDMLSLSGFGWNNEQMMLYCDRSVFDEYVKVTLLFL